MDWFRSGVILATATLVFNARGAAQTSADFFDDTVIQDIYLTVDPVAWATLQANYKDNTYYTANFTWGSISMDIQIRSHGQGSRSPVKPNLDLNFGKGPRTADGKKQRFLGMDIVGLKANNQDASAIHEKLAFQLFTRMGIPAPRESSARMYLNGEYFGFFNLVEHIDENFLQRVFDESDGALYGWEAEFFYNFEEIDPAKYAILLDQESGPDDPDRTDFAALVDAINLSPDDQFVEQVSKYLNPKLYLTHAAIENVLAEVDGIVGGVWGMNNFYLYQFEGTHRFQLLPWDKDMTFFGPALPILNGTEANILVNRLMQLPEYRDTYLDAISKATASFGGVGGWADQEITRQYNLIAGSATNDPHKQCWTGVEMQSCGAAEFEAGIAAMRTFTAMRADFVHTSLAQLGFSHPAAARHPRIRGIRQSGALPRPEPTDIVTRSRTLLTLTGENLGGNFLASAVPLPRMAGTTYVAVNGERAEIIATSKDQITFAVPQSITASQADIVVSVDGAMSNTWPTVLR